MRPAYCGRAARWRSSITRIAAISRPTAQTSLPTPEPRDCACCATARAIWACGTERAFCSELRVAVNEGFGAQASFVIGKLLRRAFHEVAGRSEQRAANPAVERQLGAAHRVDNDAGGIGRIPDFEFQLAIERKIPKSRAFNANITKFPIGQPWHVCARNNMRVVVGQLLGELADHRVSLGALF